MMILVLVMVPVCWLLVVVILLIDSFSHRHIPKGDQVFYLSIDKTDVHVVDDGLWWFWWRLSISCR